LSIVNFRRVFSHWTDNWTLSNAYFSVMDEQKNNGAAKSAEEKFYEFIEAAAHDLQAPLRKISVLADRAFKRDENKFDHDTQEYIRRIESCVDEMKVLISGLLTLVEADAPMNVHEICDIDKIVREIAEGMSEEINNKRVVVHIHPLPTVCGNIALYTQMFKNLLENAVKFTEGAEDSRVEIKTTTLSDEERSKFHLTNQKYYRVEISDNGIGFRSSNEQKIFEPFVRLHPRSEYEGSGLGLFICKKIVARHNGIIYAEGNEKQGARFILILPETP
jgi:signal transduction histidine kinase